MRAITKLFARSPFVPLQMHMARVSECASKTPEIVQAFLDGRSAEVEQLSQDISHLEHMADEVKRDIQDDLNRGMFFSIERTKLLDILAVQDSIADKVENLGALLAIKQLPAPQGFAEIFQEFLDKNLEAFNAVKKIIDQLQDLAASSFGGSQAQKIGYMVHDVSRLEEEADEIQHRLLKQLFANEDAFTHGEFYLWTQIFRQLGELANLSQRLANRIRVILD